MLLGPLLVVAGWATVSDSFLIPPPISSDDTGIVNSLPFEDAVGVASQHLSLPCPDCPVLAGSSEDGQNIWIEGLSSSLELEFKVENFIDADALFLNDVQLHPFDPVLSPLPLKVPQILTSTTSDVPHESHTVPLGYMVNVQVENEPHAEIGLFILDIQIVQVGDRFLENLESIEVKLLQTHSGRMMIAEVTKMPAHISAESDGQCISLLCRAKKVLADKLSQLKPTKAKSCASAARPHAKQNGEYAPTGCGRHCRPHTAHHHHRHRGFGRLSHALKSIALHVLIPIFIGIAAGIMASVIGMLVGKNIVLLWRTFYRYGQRRTYSKVQQEDGVVGKDDGDAKTLLEHRGPPPIYEDVVMTEKTIA